MTRPEDPDDPAAGGAWSLDPVSPHAEQRAFTEIRAQTVTNISRVLEAAIAIQPRDRALAPLRFIRPLAPDGPTQLKLAIADPVAVGADARIGFEPARLLIGFQNPSLGAQGPLRDYADLAGADDKALLAIDPAAIREVVGDFGVDGALAFSVRVEIWQEGGATARPPRQTVEARFEIARAEWPAESVSVELDLAAEAEFPVSDQGGSEVLIGRILVHGDADTAMIQPLSGMLDIVEEQSAPEPEATQEGRRARFVIRDLHGREAPDIVLSAGDDGQAMVERRLFLLCGAEATPEPTRTRQVAVSARLRAARRAGASASVEALARSPLDSIALHPPSGPLALQGVVLEHDAQIERFHLDLLDAERRDERILSTPLLEFADLENRRAPEALALKLRLTLTGRIFFKQSAPIRISADIAEAPAKTQVKGMLRLAASGDGQEKTSEDGRLALELGRDRRRSLDVSLLIAQSEARLKQVLQDAYTPNRPVTLRLRIEPAAIGDGEAPGAALVIERPIQFQARARATIAIDFGAAAACAAISAPGAPVRTLRFDGVELLASEASLSATEASRFSSAPETLWAHAPAGGFDLAPKRLETLRQRPFVVGLPAGRQSDPRATVAAMIKRLADDTIRLATPVWSVETNTMTDAVSSRDVLSATLEEFADRWLTAASEADGIASDGAQVVLIHPNRLGAKRSSALRAAARAMLRRLGLDPDKEAPVLVSAADAVASFSINQLPLDGRQTVRALVYDLGGSSLDLSVVEAERIAPEHGSRSGFAQTLAHGGADIGADSLDLLLFLTINRALSRIDPQRHGARRRFDLTEASADGSGAPDERLIAKRRLADAIQVAKATLTRRCREATAAELYHWPNETPFEVQVGVIGGDAEAWPVVEDARSAIQPTQDLGSGVSLLRRDRSLVLSFEKSAVITPAISRLTRFLTETAVRHAFDKAPFDRRDTAQTARHEEADYLIIAGRGALWPPIWEGLAKTLAEGGVATAFGFAQPFEETLMKTAAARGGLSRLADAIAAEPGQPINDLAALEPPQAHYALLISELGADGRETFQQLAPEASFSQIQGYSGHMRLVEAPSGLRMSDIIRDPWARTLIAPTGVGGDPRDLGLGSGAPPPRLIPPQNTAQPPELRIGDARLSADASWFGHAPALYLSQFDVSQNELKLDDIGVDDAAKEANAIGSDQSSREE
ncbi:MAG: hypothetical protein ACFB0F_07755 [Neomegalonema sp.]